MSEILFYKKKLKNIPKKTPSTEKNKVLDEKTKIVVRMVNLELVYPKPQLDQILKPIRILFCTKLYTSRYTTIHELYTIEV